MIFETHAHYDDDRFKDDRDETINASMKRSCPDNKCRGFYWLYHDYNRACREI